MTLGHLVADTGHPSSSSEGASRMSTISIGTQATVSTPGYVGHRLAGITAAALATYGAYGDPHAKSSQESAVPSLAGASCVVAALAFGLLVPRVTRPAVSRAGGIGTGIGAVVLTPIAFWSDVPLVLDAAAVVGGRRGRAGARDPRPAGQRPQQRADRGAAAHHGQDRTQPRVQRPYEARRVRPSSGDRPGPRGGSWSGAVSARLARLTSGRS
jgi:hypothetical protein